MTVTIERQGHQVPAADRRRRQLHVMQAMLAGAAAIAMLAVFDAGRPITAQSVLASGSVRLADVAADLPAQATAHLGPLCPQSPPNLVGGAGFAADDTDDQALQQMQQAEQQAEQQQALATQEAQQAEQQGLQTEQQANLSNP
jgi:hypothetical protein